MSTPQVTPISLNQVADLLSGEATMDYVSPILLNKDEQDQILA